MTPRLRHRQPLRRPPRRARGDRRRQRRPRRRLRRRPAGPPPSETASASTSARGPRAFPVFNGTGANVALPSHAVTRPLEAVICAADRPPQRRRVRRPRADRRRQAAHRRRPTTASSPRSCSSARSPGAASATSTPPSPRVVSISNADRARHRLHRRRDSRPWPTSPTPAASSSTSTAPASPTPPPPSAPPSRELTTDAGVDLALLRRHQERPPPRRGRRLPARGPGRRTSTSSASRRLQLASKMRFLSAQLDALLSDDLWLRNARTPTRWPPALAEALTALPDGRARPPGRGQRRLRPPARRPRSSALEFGARRLPRFYVWDEAERVVRLMCSWDTTEDDVREFAATPGIDRCHIAACTIGFMAERSQDGHS